MSEKKENPIMQLMIKSDIGEFEYQQMTIVDLVKWYRKNIDEEGNVKTEIVIFQDVILKVADDGSIPWVMSDFSVDRDLERIDPTGWDLKNFKKNPVVLWSHEHMRPAIGAIDNPRVKDNQLIGRVRFSSKEVDPFAAMIEGKVREGIIRGGSVGFRSHKIEIVDDPKEPAVLIYRKQELYEFSIGNIPTNINALALRSTNPEEGKETKDSLNKLFAKTDELEQQIRRLKKPSYIDSLLKQDRHETSGIKHLLRSGTKQT